MNIYDSIDDFPGIGQWNVPSSTAVTRTVPPLDYRRRLDSSISSLRARD
jgi:hypothetical protein